MSKLFLECELRGQTAFSDLVQFSLPPVLKAMVSLNSAINNLFSATEILYNSTEKGNRTNGKTISCNLKA